MSVVTVEKTQIEPMPDSGAITALAMMAEVKLIVDAVGRSPQGYTVA